MSSQIIRLHFLLFSKQNVCHVPVIPAAYSHNLPQWAKNGKNSVFSMAKENKIRNFKFACSRMEVAKKAVRTQQTFGWEMQGKVPNYYRRYFFQPFFLFFILWEHQKKSTLKASQNRNLRLSPFQVLSVVSGLVWLHKYKPFL
jgi:hypothetical protein